MRTRFVVTVAICDLLSLVVAVAVASELVLGTPFPWQATVRSVWPFFLFMVGSMILMSILTEKMGGPGVPRPTYGRMSVIGLGTILLTANLIVFFRDVWYSRPLFLASMAIWIIPASVHRFIQRRGPWEEKIAVISGEKKLIDELAEADHADVIWVRDPQFDGAIDLPDWGVTVAVDLRAVLSERMAQFVSSCDLAGYTIRPFSSVYEEHVGRVPLVHMAEGWEISAPLLQVARWLPGKRVVDLVLSITTIPLWVPLGCLVGLYVKIADGNSVIFNQERVGLGGEVFVMHKFRTMKLDSEDNGPQFASERDPRLIRGGSFLRKSRLDEIPQLWNVIKGDMALVGPRAEQVPFVEEFRSRIPFYDHRHLVRPGITGWAQVSYGYADDEADTIEKLTYDLYYIKHMSPVADLRIFWKSIWTVLSGSGAR